MKCVIIDDEPLAQQLIGQYIADVPSLEVVGRFQNGLEAMDLLRKQSVDLLFLDINMPKINGLDLLRSMRNPPVVIITTAYREYAVDAYELDVVDYLEKPYSFHRFLRAIEKAKEKMIAANVNQVPPPSSSSEKSARFIFVKTNKKSLKIHLDDIHYVESLSDYVRFHLSDQRLTIHATLKNVEQWLPANEFPRIHKSYMVALSKVVSVEGNQVKLAEQDLPIGSNYRKAFLQLVESHSRS